jgi:antirestriction protein ArdC
MADVRRLSTPTAWGSDDGIGRGTRAAVEAIVATGTDIRYGGSKAFYSPAGDFIQCPPGATFTERDEFSGTIVHETSHRAEHPHRLNWSRKEKENTYAPGARLA